MSSEHRRPLPRVTGRAIVLGVLIIGLLLSAMYPLRTYLAQRADIRSLEQRAHLLTRANQRLGGQIDDLRDPEYIERLARECLGMARPGETTFVVVTPGRPGPPPGC
jgi:cell division protein FtsB